MMSKQNIPELRFPEFSAEWENRQLKDSMKLLKSGLSRELSSIDIGLPVIRANNIINGRLDLSNIKYWYINDPKGAKTENYTLDKGDILVNFINSESKMGVSCIIENDFSRDTIYTTNILRYVLNEGFDNYFHYTFTQTHRYKKWIKIITKPAVNQASFTTVDFKKIEYYLPKINEQKKIGDFFRKIDQLIEMEEKKLELLEEQKKGYMQKIFYQELRFKDEDSNDYPEWRNRNIEELGTIVTGNTPSKKVEKYWNSNDFVWATPSDISNKKYIETSEVYLSDEGYKKARRLPEGSLLITCIASIGKNAILNIEGSCNQQINAIIPKKEYDVNYLYYRFEEISKYMKLIAGKTATQILNKSAFEKLSIDMPVFEEQVKIGDFLSKLDKKIESQQKKIDYILVQKQGLLQEMFI